MFSSKLEFACSENIFPIEKTPALLIRTSKPQAFQATSSIDSAFVTSS
jgi:hypothetical protein